MTDRPNSKRAYGALAVACGLLILVVVMARYRRESETAGSGHGPQVVTDAGAQRNRAATPDPSVAAPATPTKASEAEAQDEEEADEAVEGESEQAGAEPAFSRPEDRGEDLSKLGQGDLLKRLAESKDRVELRKAAKVLGDRSIAGTLTLSEQESALLTNAVQKCLQQVRSKDSNEREEAREQAQRFWWSAAPALLNNISSQDAAIAETAVKSLVLMRNEPILRDLMNMATTAPDLRTRVIAIFTLGKMTEQRESLIPGRTCMDPESSKKLAGTLLRPFLDGLAKTETNAVVLNAVSSAINDLTLAADRRLVPAPEDE